MPEPTGRQYRPGDVANGWILVDDGPPDHTATWQRLPVTDTRHPDYQPPIGAGPPLVPNTTAPTPRKSHKVRNAILIALAVLACMVACSVAVASRAGNELDDLERATTAPSFGTDPATPEAAAAAPAPAPVAEPDEADDVVVDGVTVDQFGFATVAATITNNSSKASTYLGTVDLFSAADPNVVLAQATLVTGAVAPGGVLKADALASIENAPADLSARLAQVERFAS